MYTFLKMNPCDIQVVPKFPSTWNAKYCQFLCIVIPTCYFDIWNNLSNCSCMATNIQMKSTSNWSNACVKSITKWLLVCTLTEIPDICDGNLWKTSFEGNFQLVIFTTEENLRQSFSLKTPKAVPTFVFILRLLFRMSGHHVLILEWSTALVTNNGNSSARMCSILPSFLAINLPQAKISYPVRQWRVLQGRWGSSACLPLNGVFPKYPTLEWPKMVSGNTTWIRCLLFLSRNCQKRNRPKGSLLTTDLGTYWPVINHRKSKMARHRNRFYFRKFHLF